MFNKVRDWMTFDDLFD